MSTALPPTALSTLRAIRELSAANGYPPAFKDLCAALRLGSTNSLACRLSPLRRLGLVTWVPGKARTLRLTAAGLRVVLGKEAA